MTIELDWDVTDAPIEDDIHSPKSIVNPTREAPRPVDRRQVKPLRGLTARGARRWWWLAGLVMLAAVAVGALWYVTQAGWQGVTADVAAAANYEDKEAGLGATSLVLNVQDHGNADWLSIRQDEVLARQPAPLPVPMLDFGQTPSAVTGVTALDSDFVLVNVNRQFTTPGGQSLTFTLPQFYRRGTANDWLRSAPPGTFWGNWLNWNGTLLIIRYSERDAAFVSQMGLLLDQRLQAACAAWSGGCPGQTPVRLYLSGFVGSLEYNPLANTEVRVELGSASGSAAPPAEYFLSVPSPQIAGIPADEAGRRYLADYLSVRLIASLARHQSDMPLGYYQQTAQAIQALGLASGDPGYLVVGRRPAASPFGQTSRPFAQGSNFPARGPDRLMWRVVYYTTVPGDTLPGVAARFNTSVNAIARANRLGRSTDLATGVKLTIPLFTSGSTTQP